MVFMKIHVFAYLGKMLAYTIRLKEKVYWMCVHIPGAKAVLQTKEIQSNLNFKWDRSPLGYKRPRIWEGILFIA